MKISLKELFILVITFVIGYIIGGLICNSPIVIYEESDKVDSIKLKCDSLKVEAEKLMLKEDSIRMAYDSIVYELKNKSHEKINHIKSLSIDSSILFLREELSREDSIE